MTSDKSADIVAFGRMDAKEAPAADREYAVTLDVEVAPEFKMPEYKGLEIKVEDGETLEQHIENRMKYLKDLYADYVTIEEPAQKGDMLKVSYESDFVPAEDAPASLRRAVKSEESWIWLSEPEQIPGVLAALTGAKKDGEYTFKAEFPADWREKDLQGKSVEYKVKVFEAQRRVPVADDAKLAEKLGREPTDAEIAKDLDYSERTVAGLRLADLRTFSLHDPIQQGEDGEFQDIIPDRGAMTPDRILSDVVSVGRLVDLLGELDERERMILKMRFGLDGTRSRTLEEVSQEIGRTRERVRQIQNQALSKLRDLLVDEAGFANE